MIGHLFCVAEGGRRPRAVQETVCALPLLSAAVLAPPGGTFSALCRRTQRAGRLLVGAGVRRVLTPEDFPYGEWLYKMGLMPVDTVPLCRALAPQLALCALARSGTPPCRATVELRSSRVSRPLFTAALALAPQVQCLVIAAPNGGGALGEHLRTEWGVAVREPGGPPPDLILQFTQEAENCAKALALYGPNPNLQGFSPLWEGAPAAQRFAQLPLAAILWETGLLPLSGIKLLDRSTQTTYNMQRHY